jgi:hypothetical protein
MSDTIEYGNVYFLFRPKVEHESVHGSEEVQRLFVVLSPHGKRRYRVIVIGGKRLPEVEDGGERLWGFIDRVESDPRRLRPEFDAGSYETKTRGERHVPAVRPAGEGVYALVRHGSHTHFAYALELPASPGEVQQAFNIEPEASFVISVKNPDQPSPRRAGLREEQQAHFPKRLQAQFHGRRFAPVDPPDFLDHAGAELVLVGASEEPERELGVDLEADEEDAASADIFRDLRLRKSEHPVRPLFEGRWE